MGDADDLAAELGEYATRLATTDPGAPPDDLAAVGESLADARVVGMGEATHGTREFFRLKHRLLRYLVEERGFRLFAIEANLPESMAVDDYVTRGEGDPEAALDGIYFWTWNTEEVLALVEYLRSFNDGRDPGDRVRFFGFDAQFTPGAGRALEDYLERVDPALRERVADELAVVTEGVTRADDEGAVSDRLDAADRLASAVRERLDDRAGEYADASSPRDLDLARRHCRVIEQVVERTRAEPEEGDGAAYTRRDRAMAENVEWILQYADRDRIALWGHNGHVKAGEVPNDDWDEPGLTMGHFLRERFGEEYYALGFEFGRGEFRAIPGPERERGGGPQPFALKSIPGDSLPAVLDAVGDEPYFLDLRRAGEDGSLAAYLGSERRNHAIGALYFAEEDWNYGRIVPAEEFDGLVYVPETRATEPVRAE